MADLQNIADTMGGVGAALTGDLSNWNRNKIYEDQSSDRTDMLRKDQIAKFETMRKQTMLEDSVTANAFLDNDDPQAALRVFQERIPYLRQLGQNTDGTQWVIDKLTAAINGDKAAETEVTNSLRTVANVARDNGMLGGRGSQFGASSQFKDEENNIYSVTQVRDPKSGQVRTAYTPVTPGAPPQPVGQVSRLNSSTGMTPDEALKNSVDTELGKSQANQSIAMSSKMFEAIQPLKSSITLYDDAIAAIEEGAGTGPIMDILPSVRKASIELDNIGNRAGLAVIQSATFGALSKGELDMAMSTAMPRNLQEEDLKQWLTDKKSAQMKLLRYYERAAQFMGDGGKVSDFVAQEKARYAEDIDGLVNQYGD